MPPTTTTSSSSEAAAFAASPPPPPSPGLLHALLGRQRPLLQRRRRRRRRRRSLFLCSFSFLRCRAGTPDRHRARPCLRTRRSSRRRRLTRPRPCGMARAIERHGHGGRHHARDGGGALCGNRLLRRWRELRLAVVAVFALSGVSWCFRSDGKQRVHHRRHARHRPGGAAPGPVGGVVLRRGVFGVGLGLCRKCAFRRQRGK